MPVAGRRLDDMAVSKAVPTINTGLALHQANQRKAAKKANKSCTQMLMIAAAKAPLVLALLIVVLLAVAYMANSFHMAYKVAEKRIEYCNNMTMAVENHPQKFAEFADAASECFLISQANVWLFATDVWVSRTALMRWIGARLASFGQGFDGTVTQHINMLFVFLALASIIVAGSAYVVVQWMRQYSKAAQARRELDDYRS